MSFETNFLRYCYFGIKSRCLKKKDWIQVPLIQG